MTNQISYISYHKRSLNIISDIKNLKERTFWTQSLQKLILS